MEDGFVAGVGLWCLDYRRFKLENFKTGVEIGFKTGLDEQRMWTGRLCDGSGKMEVWKSWFQGWLCDGRNEWSLEWRNVDLWRRKEFEGMECFVTLVSGFVTVWTKFWLALWRSERIGWKVWFCDNVLWRTWVRINDIKRMNFLNQSLFL